MLSGSAFFRELKRQEPSCGREGIGVSDRGVALQWVVRCLMC